MKPSNRSGIRLSLKAVLVTLGLVISPVLAASGPTTLSGTYQSTIVDWPKGKTGTIQIGTVSRGVVDANGHFSLNLPTAEQVADMLMPIFDEGTKKSNLSSKETCQGQGTSLPSSARGTEVVLQATIDGGAPIALKLKSDTHLPYPLGQGYSSLTYFDVQVKLDGTITCAKSRGVYKGTFPAGWSLPSGTVTDISKDGVYTDVLTPDALPAAVTWHLYDLYVGIGITLSAGLNAQAGYYVSALQAGTPADQAGIRLNDLLTEVDGKDVRALPIEQVLDLVRGAANTPVTLGVVRGSGTVIKRIKVTRAEIQAP